MTPRRRASWSSPIRPSIRPNSRAATATSSRRANKRPRRSAAHPHGMPVSGGGYEPLHFFQRLAFDLADALGGNLELGGELVQCRLILLAQPARFDDAAAARVEARQGVLQAARAKRFFLLRLGQLRGLGRAIGQIRYRSVGVILVTGRLERDLLPGQAHLHFTE